MEESLVITEVTEKDVVMEAITTQIKEAGSMECTVEIVVYIFFHFFLHIQYMKNKLFLQVNLSLLLYNLSNYDL